MGTDKLVDVLFSFLNIGEDGTIGCEGGFIG